MPEVSNNLLEASYKFYAGQEVDNGDIQGTIKKVGLNSIFVQKADGTVIKVTKKEVRKGNIFNHIVASIEKHILKLEEKKALAIAQQREAAAIMKDTKAEMEEFVIDKNVSDSSELTGHDGNLYAQLENKYSDSKHTKNRASMTEYGCYSTLLSEYLDLGEFQRYAC